MTGMILALYLLLCGDEFVMTTNACPGSFSHLIVPGISVMRWFSRQATSRLYLSRRACDQGSVVRTETRFIEQIFQCPWSYLRRHHFYFLFLIWIVSIWRGDLSEDRLVPVGKCLYGSSCHSFRSWVCSASWRWSRLTEIPRPILWRTAGFSYLKYASHYIFSHESWGIVNAYTHRI